MAGPIQALGANQLNAKLAEDGYNAAAAEALDVNAKRQFRATPDGEKGKRRSRSYGLSVR
jgi:hypothetical protein